MMKLPKTWRAATVADVCEMRNGHGFGPEDWDTTGLPIIRIQNLNGGQKFDYFSGAPDERWLVEPGQMLFSWAGTKGVSFGPTIWRGKRGVLNQHIFKVQPNEDIHGEWLYWALKHVTRRIESQSHGFKATLVHVKKSDIDRQPIMVPLPREQRRIAHILFTWDQAIATSERLVANSREWADDFCNAVLSGQRRFGNYAPWKPKLLSEMIRESRVIGSGGHVAKKLTVKLYGKGVVGKSEKRLGSESTQYYRRSAGQFIYSKLDFLNGAFGIVPDALDSYESTLDLPAFDFLDGVEPRWFLQHVSREAFYVAHLGLANGGRKARRVNPADLLRLSIQTPCLEEQIRIADAIGVVQTIVHLHDRQLTLLRVEKDALVSHLLTGKRRVRLTEAKTEAQA